MDDGYGSQISLAPTDYSKVCARTCGIRVKRIADYSDFGKCSGLVANKTICSLIIKLHVFGAGNSSCCYLKRN